MAISQSTPAFIERIAANPDEAKKLRALGTESPEHLFSQIRAAPDAFERYLGHERVRALLSKLRQLVPANSPALGGRGDVPGKLGVPLGPSPGDIASPDFDIHKRDALFQRIQNLKQRGASRRAIRAAEDELDRLLDGRV